MSHQCLAWLFVFLVVLMIELSALYKYSTIKPYPQPGLLVFKDFFLAVLGIEPMGSQMKTL
jgi:hypothetical protein